MSEDLALINPKTNLTLKNRLLQMDHLDAMLAYWDKNQVCRFANTAYLTWFGKTRKEMIDKITLWELLGPLYELNLTYITQALQGKVQQFEREITIPTGEKRYSVANYYPDVVDGKVEGFYVHITDITRLKKLELVLAASENKFKTLLENAPDAMVISNRQGIIQLINTQTERMFGYKRDELLGNSIHLLLQNVTGSEKNNSDSAILQLPDSATTIEVREYTARHHNGSKFPVEVSLGPIELDGIPQISAAIRNISKRKEIELALEESNKRNLIFVQQSPSAIAMFDRDMKYLAASKKWLLDYQLDHLDIVGRSHYEIFPEIGEDWKKIHRDCMAGDINHCDEAIFERADGSVQWLTWDVRPWYLSENNIGGIIMYTADITELKEKDKEKRNIEEILDRTNEVARIGTWEVDLINDRITWSRITREIHEVSPDYVPQLDKAISFFKEGESRERITKVFNEAITNGTGYDGQFEIISAKGNDFWVRAIGQPEIKNGKCFRVYGVFQDITQTKKYELQLQESNERNRIFVQEAPNAIAMFDREMKYLAASKKWVKDYNLAEQDIIGRSHYDIFPEIGEDWKQIHRECLQGAINQCDEAQFERADGSLQWITWDVRPWYISENNIGGIIMYTADITELKNKDKEKKIIEEILERTNEVARIGTWEYTLKDHSIKWSRMVKQIHEVDADFEPTFEKIISFYTPESQALLLKAVDNAVQFGINYDLELEIITSQNKHLWIRGIGQAEFKKGVCTRLYGIFQDIDESKRYKQSLSKLNNELTAILNSGHVSIIGTDLNGTITHFNKGAEILLQYTAEEMIGKRKPFVIHLLDEVIERGKDLSKKFGRLIEGDAIMTELANLGQIDAREWTYVRKDGTSFPVQLIITAIKNEQGESVGYLGVATDITEIKNAQKEMKSLLDITTDQNDRLKNFAHIVSHNLRSHSGNIDMILDLYIHDNPAVAQNEYVSLLKTSSGNLKETIANLNEVVLINTAFDEKLVSINLYNRIEAACGNINQIAHDACVTINNRVDTSVTVQAIPAYLDSIILNFITNGIKYRSVNKPAFVTISNGFSDDFTVLIIEDNGLGIDLERYGSRIFGMYKTFHGNSDARGIGLFITKNQVEAMGGKIEVESTVGTGTTFKVYFKNEKN